MRWRARSIGAVILLAGCSTALAADVAPELPTRVTYSVWIKTCQIPKNGPLGPTCFTGMDGRDESGKTVIGVVVIKPEGDPKPILRATVPLGVQLVHGTRLILDDDPPQLRPYLSCFANGCLSDYEATPEMIARLRKGRQLIVQAIGADGKATTWVLLLRDFAAAYDGPAVAYEDFEQQRKQAERKARRLLHDDTLDPRYRPRAY